jgi:(2Fe-2S) ferredoxin
MSHMTTEKVEVFVCMNVDCRSRGSEAMLGDLKAQLAAKGMNHVVVENIMCFSACNVGPNVVMPATRCWLSGVTPDDASVVVEHLQGKPVDARFTANNDPEIDTMIFEIIDAGLLDKM